MHMRKTLSLVRGFRDQDHDTPIILMGYYNPIYIYGVAEFLEDARNAGVDGLIVVDLPPEEDAELCVPTVEKGLSFIRLTTPTSDDKRLPKLVQNTSGFVYYVSVAGVTGAGSASNDQIVEAMDACVAIPICRLLSGLASRPQPRLRMSQSRQMRLLSVRQSFQKLPKVLTKTARPPIRPPLWLPTL